MSIAQPLLGYGSVGASPVLSFLNQFAFLPSIGFIASGITKTGGSSSPVVRFASTVNGLTTASDQALPSEDTSIFACYALSDVFVVGDSLGAIFTSMDGSTWNTANNPDGVSIQGLQNAVFDDVNNKIVITTSNPAEVVTTTPGSGVLTFSTHSIVTSTNIVAALAYRPGSGVTLAILESGGADHGNVYRSVDGGATWSITAAHIFGLSVNNSFEIFYAGVDNWVAFGGDTSGLLCISTDNGSTWSSPSVWSSVTATMFIATNNSGNLLSMTNAGSNYFISIDNGNTWSTPGTLPPNDGVGAFGVVWDGSKWCINLTSTDDSAQFFVTSPDAISWTQGPNVVD